MTDHGGRMNGLAARETVEAILRPLAEWTTPCPCSHDEPGALALLAYRSQACSDCGERMDRPPGKRLDPRFDALRGKTWKRLEKIGGLTYEYWMESPVDVSLGAIRAAMVACGWNRLSLTTYGAVVIAEVCHSQASRMAGTGRGDTDQEAAALALVAAFCP